MTMRTGGSVALVLAEVAWGSLLLDASANGTAGPGRPAVHLPFLAFAVAGVVAVLLAATLRRWLRALLAAAVAAALTAELVAGLTPGVALWAAPTAQTAVRATTWAAIVAVLVWTRGTWLGLVPPSETQAAISMMIGWLVVFSILIGRADHPSPAFAHATSDAGWLLLVFFLSAFIAVGWAHAHTLERAATGRVGAGPGGAWLAVIAVPLVIVAAVAFLLGGAATSVVPALAGVARDLGGALSSMGTWVFTHLFNFVPHIRPHPLNAPGGGAAPTLGKHTHTSNVIVEILAAVPEVIAGVAVLVLLGLLTRFIVQRIRRRMSLKRPDEVRTSLFSWAHLMSQVRGALARLRLRLRRRRPEGDVEVETPSAVLGPTPQLGPVRAAYRRFLLAAHAATVGRDSAETPRELAERLEQRRQRLELGPNLDPGHLGVLTGAYERARYAETAEDERSALEAADALTRELSRPRREEASPGPT
jgi:hypothetical protein